MPTKVKIELTMGNAEMNSWLHAISAITRAWKYFGLTYELGCEPPLPGDVYTVLDINGNRVGDIRVIEEG